MSLVRLRDLRFISRSFLVAAREPAADHVHPVPSDPETFHVIDPLATSYQPGDRLLICLRVTFSVALISGGSQVHQQCAST